MKYLVFFIVSMSSVNVMSAGVISCGDAMSVGREARLTLHNEAQKRAQSAIEEFVEKDMVNPYVDLFGQKNDLKTMADLIEVYWCETPKTPLHSAYYRFYSSNKSVFK